MKIDSALNWDPYFTHYLFSFDLCRHLFFLTILTQTPILPFDLQNQISQLLPLFNLLHISSSTRYANLQTQIIPAVLLRCSFIIYATNRLQRNQLWNSGNA